MTLIKSEKTGGRRRNTTKSMLLCGSEGHSYAFNRQRESKSKEHNLNAIVKRTTEVPALAHLSRSCPRLGPRKRGNRLLDQLSPECKGNFSFPPTRVQSDL